MQRIKLSVECGVTVEALLSACVGSSCPIVTDTRESINYSCSGAE